MDLNAHKRYLLGLIVLLMSAGLCQAQKTGPNNPDYCTVKQQSKDVNLRTGDVNFTLPLLHVPSPEGGFSMDLTYLSGITADQEASWVGLGWGMFPGAITRNVNGYPDDWNGNGIEYDMPSGTSSFTVVSNPAHNSYVTPGFQRIMGHSKSLLGFRKRTFFASEEGNYTAYGSLYMDAAKALGRSDNYGTYRDPDKLWDVYSIGTKGYGIEDIEDPQDEWDTGMDSENQIQRLHCLTFPNYDNYTIRTGLFHGSISPRIFKAVNLSGSINNSGDEGLMYYHHITKDDLSFAQDKVYFYPNNSHSSYFRVNSEDVEFPDPGDPKNPVGFYLDTTMVTKLPNEGREHYTDSAFFNYTDERVGTAIHIEYFLNSGLQSPSATVLEKGFIEASNFTRNSTSCPDDGIGAYTVTFQNGVRYHFSLPVYQLANETYMAKNTSNNKEFQLKRKQKYAYAWLLTAITGVDYEDRGDPGFDAADHGYWVSFDYLPKSNVSWNSYHPTCSNYYPHDSPDPNDSPDPYDSYFSGEKEIYYLQSIRTRSHIAKFYLQFNPESMGGKYLLDKIIVLKDHEPTAPSAFWADESQALLRAIKVIDFTYSLKSGNDNNFLSKVKIQGHKNVATTPSYNFSYYSYGTNATDNWGYLKDNPERYSLKSVEYPMGSKKEFEYEPDVYVKKVDFSSTNREVEGGGARLRKILLTDGTTPDTETLYTYNTTIELDDDEIEETSGCIFYEPFYDFGGLESGYGLPKYYTEYPLPEVSYSEVKVWNNWDENDGSYDHSISYAFFTGVDTRNWQETDVVNVVKEYNRGETIINGVNNDDYKVMRYIYSMHDNTSRIGSLLAMKRENSFGQLVTQTVMDYFSMWHPYVSSLEEETNIPYEGDLRQMDVVDLSDPVAGTRGESFFTRKRVDRSSAVDIWFLTVSNRVWHPTVTRGIITINQGLASRRLNKKIDFYTGKAVEVGSGKSGSVMKPAYRIDKYATMGPKTLNSSNSHQLLQVAETITLDADSNFLSNQITTWENDWACRELSGSEFVDGSLENFGYYRKHESWAWKGNLSSDGTFDNFYDKNVFAVVSEDKRFDWDEGLAAKENNLRNGWKKLGVSKRYNNKSTVMETKTLAGDYFAQKHDALEEQVIAGSQNATYLQFCYTGFENEKATGYATVKHYGNEVTGDSTKCFSRISSGTWAYERTFNGRTYDIVSGVVAHTGSFYLETSNHTSPMFRMEYDGDRGVRQGRYWASVWVHNNSDDDTELKLEFFNDDPRSLNSVTMKKSESNLVVDNWVQLNVYIDVPACATYDKLMLYVTTPSGTSAYIDDLRLQPVDAKVSANVFHQETGLKVAELGETNFAVKLEYDAKGEVTAVYKETLKYGFKKVSESDYNYARGVND